MEKEYYIALLFSIMVKLRIGIIVFLAYGIMSLFSCQSASNDMVEELTGQGIKVGEDFYTAIRSEQYDTVLNLMSPRLYEMYSRDFLKDFLVNIRNKNGTAREIELLGAAYTNSYENNKHNQHITNTYKVSYSSGFVAREELTFIIDDNTKKLDKVDGYTFDFYKPE